MNMCWAALREKWSEKNGAIPDGKDFCRVATVSVRALSTSI